MAELREEKELIALWRFCLLTDTKKGLRMAKEFNNKYQTASLHIFLFRYSREVCGIKCGGLHKRSRVDKCRVKNWVYFAAKDIFVLDIDPRFVP